MAADNKIVQEIFDKITQYKDYCECITDDDGVSLTSFKSLDMGLMHWIDVRWCFIGKKVNNSHMLELFCKYTDSDPFTLRTKILDVQEEYDFWDKIGRVVLAFKETTLSSWIKYMHLPYARCDEFMLYILCRIHYRHAIVYTLKRPWTTVHCNAGFSFATLPDLCHIHLVYLGEHLYGELRPLPMSSAPTVTPYILQIPTKKIKKGQQKVLDLSCREQTMNCDDDKVVTTGSLVYPNSSYQSGSPGSSGSSDPLHADGPMVSSEITVNLDGLNQSGSMKLPSSFCTSDMLCSDGLLVSSATLTAPKYVNGLNQSGMTEPLSSPSIRKLQSTDPVLNTSAQSPEQDLLLQTSHGLDNTELIATTPVDSGHLPTSTQKSSEYSYGPAIPHNLRTLATSALSNHFPGLDPLDVAVLFAKKPPKPNQACRINPSNLS